MQLFYFSKILLQKQPRKWWYFFKISKKYTSSSGTNKLWKKHSNFYYSHYKFQQKVTAESTDMCLLSVNSAVSFVTNLRMLCVLSHDTYGLLFAIIVEDAKSTDIMKSIFTSLMISCLSYSHKPPYGIFFSFFLFCRFPGNFLAFFLCLSPSPGFSSLFSDSSCC